MLKPHLGFILLFVENPLRSADFYRTLFNLEPKEASPTFAGFFFDNGIMLGLWSKYTAEPRVESNPGCSDICIPVENVDATYLEIEKRKITVVQKPTDMDFGRTCVFIDPDGHRIRIYKLA